MENGVARRRAVVVVSRQDGRAILNSGVTVGQDIIVAGLERVVPDGAVNVVPEAQANGAAATVERPREAEPAPP